MSIDVPLPPDAVLISQSQTYDAQGRLVSEVRDLDSSAQGAGPADLRYVTTYSYDEHGGVASIIHSLDFELDGSLEFWAKWSQTIDGSSTHELVQYDFDGDGLIDSAVERLMVHDELGRVLLDRLSTDLNGDGAFDSIELQANDYSENGALIYSRYSFDEGADGVLEYDEIFQYQFNANGMMTGYYHRVDADGDGFWDSIREEVFEYDELSRVLSHEARQDDNGDLSWDRIELSVFGYDGDSHSLTWSAFSIFEGPGLQLSFRSEESTVYSAEGQLLSQTSQTDHDGDGLFDVGSSSSWQYDSAGRMTGLVQYEHEAGALVSRVNITYSYDELGRLSFAYLTYDGDGDGTDDQWERHEYVFNEDGRLIEIEATADRDGDGVADWRALHRFVYDEDGRVMSFGIRHYEGGMLVYEEFADCFYDGDGQFLFVFHQADQDADGTIDDVWESYEVPTTLSFGLLPPRVGEPGGPPPGGTPPTGGGPPPSVPVSGENLSVHSRVLTAMESQSSARPVDRLMGSSSMPGQSTSQLESRASDAVFRLFGSEQFGDRLTSLDRYIAIAGTTVGRSAQDDAAPSEELLPDVEQPWVELLERTGEGVHVAHRSYCD